MEADESHLLFVLQAAAQRHHLRLLLNQVLVQLLGFLLLLIHLNPKHPGLSSPSTRLGGDSRFRSGSHHVPLLLPQVFQEVLQVLFGPLQLLPVLLGGGQELHRVCVLPREAASPSGSVGLFRLAREGNRKSLPSSSGLHGC